MSGVSIGLPGDIYTNNQGVKERLRVDPGQTGFFTGKTFRSYLELGIPVAGPPVAFRFTSPINFILWHQDLDLTQGALRLEIFTGAVTPAGTWSSWPAGVIGVNRMTEIPQPPYVSQITLETGGTFSGGTAVDLMLLRCSANQGNQSSSNVGGETSERGLGAGVYYGRFSTLTGGIAVADAAQGIYSLIWEERP